MQTKRLVDTIRFIYNLLCCCYVLLDVIDQFITYQFTGTVIDGVTNINSITHAKLIMYRLYITYRMLIWCMLLKYNPAHSGMSPCTRDYI